MLAALIPFLLTLVAHVPDLARGLALWHDAGLIELRADQLAMLAQVTAELRAKRAAAEAADTYVDPIKPA